jgi:trehalose 6-phosphate phosphatase
LRPPVRIDKGTAVADLVAEHGLRGAIFLGDDITDVDAFQALAAARVAGSVETLTIGVVGPETPAAVRAAVDATVQGVDGAADLLATLASDLTGGGTT